MNNKIIFIKGKPGSGKSTLARLIGGNKIVVFEGRVGAFDLGRLTGGDVVVFEGWPSNFNVFDLDAARLRVERKYQAPVTIDGPKLVIVILQDGRRVPPGYLCMEMQRD